MTQICSRNVTDARICYREAQLNKLLRRRTRYTSDHKTLATSNQVGDLPWAASKYTTPEVAQVSRLPGGNLKLKFISINVISGKLGIAVKVKRLSWGSRWTILGRGRDGLEPKRGGAA